MSFMVDQGIILGHAVSSKGIEVDKTKIYVIYLTPQICGKFALFLDMQGFIDGLSKISQR